MAWKKSPPELVATYEAVAPEAPLAERRQMFGYPCAFVNGNMFMGLYEDSMMLRLSDADRAEMLAKPGARLFEPMSGRPMKEYVQVPAPLLDNRKALQSWVARSLSYASSLPVKEKKKKAAAKKTAREAPAARKKAK